MYMEKMPVVCRTISSNARFPLQNVFHRNPGAKLSTLILLRGIGKLSASAIRPMRIILEQTQRKDFPSILLF